MNTQNNVFKVLGVVGLVVVTALLTHTFWKSENTIAGAAGGMLIENYLPYVLYNQGINTALPVTSTAGASSFQGTFQIGSSGSALSNVVDTTCSPKADVSIVASSTGYAYCTGVTGVTSADTVVLAQFSTSTANFSLPADGFAIVSAKASSTAGVIDFLVMNNSGKAAVPSAVGRSASTTAIHASH